MFGNIPLLRTASLMARHATEWQSMISENIANSDTPNFKSKDITSFSSYLKTIEGRDVSSNGTDPERYRFEGAGWQTISDDSASKPNGNSVSLETEMLKSIGAEREQSRALAIYKHSVDLLRMSIGRGV